MSITSIMPSNHLILCRPLLLLPSIFPSIRVFSSESVLHIRWPKYWSFSYSIYQWIFRNMMSFRMDWLDRLAVQGILKSLLQHHILKASVLWRSGFFMVRSHIHPDACHELVSCGRQHSLATSVLLHLTWPSPLLPQGYCGALWSPGMPGR